MLISPANAQTCGDPDGDGQTTIADGIQTLRAAALLSSSCVNAACDLDGSGTININDGVNVLRKAASLSAPNACPVECDASCVERQAGALVTRVQSVMAVAVTALPGAEAAIAGGTTPQCETGSSTEDENGFTDVDCRIGDLVSNGSVAFADIPPTEDRRATFTGFSVRRISTGEILVSSGTLTISPQEAGVKVNGAVTRTSNFLGDYQEVFTDLVADTSGDEVLRESGTIVTTVTRGLGEFTTVRRLEGTIRGPQLAIVVITFQDDTQAVSIVHGDIGLCDPCTTNAECDDQLVCVPCVGNCTGVPMRCSVGGDFTATCADGVSNDRVWEHQHQTMPLAHADAGCREASCSGPADPSRSRSHTVAARIRTSRQRCWCL